ncbi:hypothetical protein AGMMS49982_16730 [Bacteroidia bacterium]|nr:hypothetical protein AGMMS49982_16730 [Bacteroidia bacterium]
MKKYIILTAIVALMSSCNGDIYDNIKEFVDSETVYPAGYVQENVKLRAGHERVEIDLCESREAELYLPRADTTVVEYADTVVTFTPARSWVNIAGLKIPQVYHFKIYTKDKYGNASTPVTAEGKPFTDEDKARLLIDGFSFTASTTQAAVIWNPAPTVYTVTGVEYSYTSPTSGQPRSGEMGTRVVFDDLSASVTTPIDISFKVLPTGAIDTVLLSGYNIGIRLMSAAELDTYLNSSTSFLLRAADTVLTSAGVIIKGADFDLGGEGKGFHKAVASGGNLTYRAGGGDVASWGFGIDLSGASSGFAGVGWATPGDWYAYTLYVQDPGVYKLEYNRATGQNGLASLTLDGADIFGIMPITNNGNWAGWQWVDPEVTIRLSAGQHKLRWTQRGPVHNFGGLRLTFVEP